MKTTLTDIKRFVESGLATDITHYSFEEINDLRKGTYFNTIAYSTGVYGLNGIVLQDNTNGKLYGIISRTNALFQMI